jgi:hypothetical protein
LAQQHPEFLLRGLDDAPVLAWTHWNEPVYALDLTRPDVQAWLRTLFTTVCFEWGYDAVKLDFVFAGALPGQPYDPTLTRAQAYRRGLEVIADTLGPDKIILGCGAPQLASLGLVDTMRVSQDVNFTWAAGDSANTGAVSTQNAVQNTLLRAPLNQHWWLNDPDCVIVRQYGDLNAMTRHETRTLASVAALTGSILLDSDNLTTVNPAYLVDLRRILPPLDRTAHVRRWFADTVEQPAELELAVGGGRMVLAVINWSDQPRPAMVSLASEDWRHVYDFWSKKYLGLHRERVKLPRCAPHETKVLQCARLTNEAQVIATSFHIAAADLAQVTQTKSGLQIVASGTPDLRGEILIQLPPRARNHRIWCNGKRARSVALGPRVIAVRFKSQARTRIELEY